MVNGTSSMSTYLSSYYCPLCKRKTYKECMRHMLPLLDRPALTWCYVYYCQSIVSKEGDYCEKCSFEKGLTASDGRPIWPRLFMEFAALLAQRSSCDRARVGCVITDEKGVQVLGYGYNGNYAGGPNGCDSDEQGGCGCLHAEVNAVAKVGAGHPGRIIYTTTLPCVQCAKLIVNSGPYGRLYYNSSHRASDETYSIFSSVGLECTRVQTIGDGFLFVEREQIGYKVDE